MLDGVACAALQALLALAARNGASAMAGNAPEPVIECIRAALKLKGEAHSEGVILIETSLKALAREIGLSGATQAIFNMQSHQPCQVLL